MFTTEKNSLLTLKRLNKYEVLKLVVIATKRHICYGARIYRLCRPSIGKKIRILKLCTWYVPAGESSLLLMNETKSNDTRFQLQYLTLDLYLQYSFGPKNVNRNLIQI